VDDDPYGLTDRPFQLTPDPRFYFDSATHRKAMTYLGYGLAQGEGFIVVTGEVGTGKTMLVGRLMATIDRSRLTAINLVSTQLEGEDILRIVALSLGVATEGATKGQLLARIERFLHEQARGGKRTLLIVDEAQNLPMSALEELRMLSNFQYGGQALLQIFLLGQPEFRDALAQPRFEQLRQRVIATHHLTAMGPDEAGPYIMHRLACAGWKGAPRFSQGAFEAFHRLSGGVPRRLNMLAARVLLQGSIERLIDIDLDVVEDVAADLASESIMPAEVKPGGQPVPFAFPEISPKPVVPSPADSWYHTPEPVSQAPAEPPVSPLPESSPPATPAVPPWPIASSEEPLRTAFSPFPDNVPPPSITQPPRYDGIVPPEAASAPAVPPISSARPSLRAVDGALAAPEQSDSPARPSPETEAVAAAVARNAELEARLEEQEKILRRTLSLLVEWVERDESHPRGEGGSQNVA
jgi:general secretion pathway protein A